MTANESRVPVGRVILGVISIGIIIAVAVDNGSSSGSTDGPPTDTIKSNCHDAVNAELTAPATAHYHNEHLNKTNDGGWSLVGNVDSENGFGALLTSTFACDTDFDGNVSGTPVLIGN